MHAGVRPRHQRLERLECGGWEGEGKKKFLESSLLLQLLLLLPHLQLLDAAVPGVVCFDTSL